MLTICLRSWRALVLFLWLHSSVAVSSECPAIPTAVRDIVSTNIYGDSGLLSGVDSQRIAERERMVKPISDFVQQTAVLASEAFEKDSQTAARCAISNLRLWAEAKALLGIANNEAANKELIWNTAGLTLAYLRVKHSATPEAATVIEAWISELARRVIDRYGGAARRDNVFCWTGLVAAAAAAATGDRLLWKRAIDINDLALSEVDSYGALRPELQRGRRALAYHNFALVPLMATVALRERAGYSTPTSLQEALSRLAIFTGSAVRDPSILTDMTGEFQDAPSTRNVVAWKYIAFRRLNSFRDSEKYTDTGVPFERWLGGGVSFFVDHN